MDTYADKTSENKSTAVGGSLTKQQNSGKSIFQFEDNRPEVVTQRKLQSAANQYVDRTLQPIQKQKNNTGLPDNLKAGIENISAFSMDDVKVHYNSDKPAQLQAHAYAQGTDIHLAPGQEKHLPHEAWHVVQQKQGRVKATLQLRGKVNVNDDLGLEKEADVMGDRALNSIQMKTQTTKLDSINLQENSAASNPVQRIRIKLDHASDAIMHNVRASKVPKPGTKKVDGFESYDNSHPPIKSDENIILEGHGTHLNSNPKGPYDSQAELTPQQLANIAFMVPKPDNWNGQIILFGCATGVLTLEVSKHFLALSGKSVNVVGTLADIRMEVPTDEHPEHRAEYDRVGGKFPKTPKKDPLVPENVSQAESGSAAATESVSARTQFLRWLMGVKKGTMEALTALAQFNDLPDTVRNKEGRDHLVNKLATTLQYFRHALAAKTNYEGMIYNSTDNSERDIEEVIQMLLTADDEIKVYKTSLVNPAVQLDYLDDQATKLGLFFGQLMKNLDVLDRLAMRSENAVPEGVVDWEGENVQNSRATNADDASGIPLEKEDLISDKWGKRGGGGQMLVQIHTRTHEEEDH